MPILRKDEGVSIGREASANINALLGKGSEFEGKLTFEGTVRIDGRFSGEIFSEETLVVGEGAKLKAEVTVGTLVLYGEVIGNVRATHAIEAHSPARLIGNIVSPSLMIESGVIFEGQCRMENIDVKGEKFPFVKTEPPISMLTQQKKE
ncbi:MAG: polymer-forming cytoskeletal protein [Deltaproteobacteria bacterium]|nr:polymer-forming cytoskeletal protein [Deltaproteobacteria bacterium]